jgi:hypothetical protein
MMVLITLICVGIALLLLAVSPGLFALFLVFAVIFGLLKGC